VLVSNREPELQAVARQIAGEHSVAIQTIAMDLARPDAAFELYEDVRHRGL
jgi:short-subunit dehydrogenase